MRRLSAATCLLVITGPVLMAGAACSVGGSDEENAAESTARDLASAMAAAAAPPASESESPDADASEDAEATEGGAPATDPFAGVAFAGGDPQAVAESFEAIVDDMDGIAPTVDVDEVVVEDDTATATLAWSWPVVADEEPWAYDTTVPLARSGDEWAVRWSPAVVEPSLEDGEVLDAVTLPTDRGDITGAGGEVLVTERPVVRVGIDRTRVPARVAPQSARRLADLVGIDPAPYVTAVRGAGSRAFVEAITYREGEVPTAVVTGLREIEGAHQVGDEIALAPSREFAAPILGRVGPVTAEMVEKDPDAYRPGDVAGVSGLQARYDAQLRGSVGRMVEAVPSDAGVRSRELYRHAPVAGEPLALTLDQDLQLLAEEVLADVGPASALVALRPSDGAILAAANGAGTGGLNHATFGQFAPGSTFKVVTSLALLRAGLTPESPVRCTPTVSVDGKSFKNYSDYPSDALGPIPLRRAIAESCNTALIDTRDRLGEGDLAAAAATLGLGVDHDLGFPAYFGQVPPPASETEAAADLIGQGKVLASPMVMAAVIGSVQAGRTVVPRLVEQVAVEVPDEAAPLAPGETRALRAMLREVVTSGSGTGLADLAGPPVIAKTGTAEYVDGGSVRTHAWMIAAQGDLAVAAFVQTGESGSRTAGPLLEAFLRGAR